jgi:hypothetical protein
MEIANCLVALGGNQGNTVPKYGVSAAEVAVLLSIHGIDAVMNVDPVDSEDRNPRAELDRLKAAYPAKDGEGNSIVGKVYPGHSPSLHENFADVGLPESAFKTLSRAKPKASKAKPKAKDTPAPVTGSETDSANNADALFQD